MGVDQLDAVVVASAAVINRPGKTWAGSRNMTLHAVIDTMLVELALLPNNPPLDQKHLAQALKLAVANSNRELTWNGQPKRNHPNALVRKGWVDKVAPGKYRLSAEGRMKVGLSNFQLQEMKETSSELRAIGDAEADPNTAEIEADEGYLEGRNRELLKSHRQKERSPKAVLQKKKKVLAETGKLLCEVCDLDFTKKYGLPLGKGFAECHHIIPFSHQQGERRIRLGDLAIVCANCHRMLHRRPYHSIAELRKLVLIHRERE